MRKLDGSCFILFYMDISLFSLFFFSCVFLDLERFSRVSLMPI